MTTEAQQFLSWFQRSWDLQLGWENARFVVLDTESTGFDTKRDRIISIGAVGMMHFQIMLEDSFEVMMPIAYNTSSVTVHGITKEQAESGVAEKDALRMFLGYLRDGILVGHHLQHDVDLLNNALQQHFGISLPNLKVDTADLTFRLQDLGAFADYTNQLQSGSLDHLCSYFGILPHDRHTASGDAFLTAQIFLKLLKRAKQNNLLRLGQLTLED
ncbi:MAG: 3'-5' exonuclease [Verrucomicrobia bacterium]|nr:3'-5' exonuclease [Verrucomicrobiota bacterium]